MNQWTVPLSAALPENLVGRKAAALSRLVEQGFPVPAGVCVTTQAFYQAVSTHPSELRLPDGLLDELTGAFPANMPLAVRSSAVREDMPGVSFAGRYSTQLNVIGTAALAEAVLDCWRSYMTAPAAESEGGMAVLVQPMLDAECAGVCFTLDPVRLRPDLMLVVSAWGLGAGVVDGAVPTDTARLRRTDLNIEEYSVSVKHTALRSSGTDGGILPVPVPDELRAVPCLPDSWLERVGQFGLALEQVFGAPQDVEWTVADGQLWILQSRPITALPAQMRAAAYFPIAWENEDEARQYWWLEDFRSGAPLLPAEQDFIRIKTKGGQDSVYYGGSAYTRWRKYVNGRVYMAAAKSPNSPGHVRVYSAAIRDLHERLVQQNITWWEYWGPEIVQATERLAAFNSREKDGAALADHLEDAVAAAARHWMVHTIVPGRPIRSAALLDLYARLTGLPSGEIAAEFPFLLAGAETTQTRLVEALYDLACLALKKPEAAKTIALAFPAGCQENPAQADSFTPELEPFASAFSRLMDGYGDRMCYRAVPGCPADLPLPWRESPEHVWEMVAAYLPLARQGGPDPLETRLETLRSADQRIESLCSSAIAAGVDPALVKEFRRRLAYTRRNAAFLDEHNHYIDLVSEGQYIQALLHAGRWLAACSCLRSLYDVFWLNTDEVLAALRGTPADLGAVIAARRSQYAEWKSLIAPACLGLPDAHLPERPVHSQHTAHPAKNPEGQPAGRLIGDPASRGQARGRARLVLGDTIPADILPGDVLVIQFAGPLLIPFLPAAAAVVLDMGSPGDHFAITAREFGIPSVCATGWATRRIPEGAWVTVDADVGLVTWT